MITKKLDIQTGLTLFFILFWFLNCEKEKFEEKIPKQLPSITLEKFSLTETKTGKKLWTLNASIANVYSEIIKVDTVKIRFYNENQEEFAQLKALAGELNNRTHNILVKDNVALFTSDSTKLFTDSLFWQNDSQIILTDAHVKILKSDSTVIEGKGLKTSPDLKKIEIIGDVKGTSPIQLPKIK